MNGPVTEALERAGVVPVVTIDDAGDAPELAAALVAGGLPAIEVTLRTPAGLDAIGHIATTTPAAIVGAGSVLSGSSAVDAIAAGARFIVSPGLDADIIAAANEQNVLAIPGIATATELWKAVDLGVDIVKLFPAEAIGGSALIKALSAVWPTVRFMPTGGIDPSNAEEYLALPQVVAVGGSWMVSPRMLAEQDWAAVTAAASAATRLTEPRR